MTKKVLVTGADGFIGSHLCEQLVIAGYEVRALALYNSFNSWGWLDTSIYIDDIEVVTGDVRDPFCCHKICEGVDWAFNLAALIAIPYSYQAPESYLSTNINGALNMCEAAKAHGLEKLIQISTSEVYGTAQYVPIDETHPLQPQSPYSASKIGADSIALSYYNAFELPVIIGRPFNTYGPRQSARAVIPSVITQIAAGKKILELGDLTPTRDFNFVTDTANALIALANTTAYGEVVNLGSNTEISIQSTLELIVEIMGSNVEIRTAEERIRPANSEVFRLVCENKKFKELTAYEYKYSLEEGLKETIDWFTKPENLIQYKTGIYNV